MRSSHRETTTSQPAATASQPAATASQPPATASQPPATNVPAAVSAAPPSAAAAAAPGQPSAAVGSSARPAGAEEVRTFDVRPASDLAEFADAMLGIGQYFGAERSEERAERFLRCHPLDRMHAARDGGRVVGGAGAFPFELTVPGGTLPTAGVTVVGVYPSHRRRGVLRAMMRAQLDDVRRRGEPLAALWASEETIYGRFGYGMAALAGEISLPRERTGFALPFTRRGRLRILDTAEALDLFPPVYDRVRVQTPGLFTRSRDWWDARILFDPEDRRAGAGPKRLLAVELDGTVAGYAIYRHQTGWADGVAGGRLEVQEAVADGYQATREVWRYLLDIDLVATIWAYRLPIDHPLLLMLANPRRMTMRIGDGLWVRLVDVGPALSGRAYAGADGVVFDVVDGFCEWNAGPWKLADGHCRRTDEQPDLRLDVSALGSAYLGGFTFGQLHRAGRVEELRPDAVARADALFHLDSMPYPWCPEMF